MRALLEVIQFEIRYQLRSPFFLGALLLFALIHFMAFTGVINLDVGALVAINSTYALLQNELVFFILGLNFLYNVELKMKVQTEIIMVLLIVLMMH